MQVRTESSNILTRIVERRRETVAHRKRVLPDVALKIAVEKKSTPVRDFAGALAASRLNIIAELKKASPSKGVLREDYRPIETARSFEATGAAALSVLTEEDFFCGALGDLKQVSGVTTIPVLRKDFIIDPWQIWEARAANADSFLLIAAILDEHSLAHLLTVGRTLGMEALVETHSHDELTQAVDAGAKIIGINNRDLKTFEVSIEKSLELIESVPQDCVAVSESGIRNRAELIRLRQAGFDAFLIGEQLMTAPEPSAELAKLFEES